MEMITFTITDMSLHYASFCGGLTLEIMLTFFIFKYNLGARLWDAIERRL